MSKILKKKNEKAFQRNRLKCPFVPIMSFHSLINYCKKIVLLKTPKLYPTKYAKLLSWFWLQHFSLKEKSFLLAEISATSSKGHKNTIEKVLGFYIYIAPNSLWEKKSHASICFTHLLKIMPFPVDRGRKLNIYKTFSMVTTYFCICIITEAVAQRCSVKRLFLEILQNSQENSCASLLK